MEETIEAILRMLNKAFEEDPAAIHALMINLVPCNEDLANDEHIPVQSLPGVRHTLPYSVSALGLINGVLSAAGLPLVATLWDDRDEQGCHTFKGFVRFDTPEHPRVD